MSWTDERIAILRRMWAERYSASQIADRLGNGITRNAVIGKVTRLGLSGGSTKRAGGRMNSAPRPRVERRAPPRQTPERKISDAPPVTSSKRVKPGPVPRHNPVQRYSPLAGGFVDAQERPRRAPDRRHTGDLFEALPDGEGVHLADLERHHCRWPHGDPRDAANFRFCGEARETGASYCSFHREMSEPHGSAQAHSDTALDQTATVMEAAE